ncbi:MAG: hypothetical protein DLM72_06990 [Candidatus Nitrosopolaris wilkensis]|nr:MAG: hypothetical protein DLM72_06990 [Candidatus Nitrosopolaris wilkensis]
MPKGQFNDGDDQDGGTVRRNNPRTNGFFAANDNTQQAPESGTPEGNGIWGFSMVPNASEVFGANNNGGIGVGGMSGTGIDTGIGPIAGQFRGDVEVTGDIRLSNADCAEDFDISEAQEVDPGTVMVLNELGKLQPSYRAYYKKVAGIISGAGGHKPAIVLDKQKSQYMSRMPIALMGKAYCKVDARYHSIEIGDLLTTSSTPGHAMKADDPIKAFGTVIGKALRSLKKGKDLIPVLVPHNSEDDIYEKS